MKYAKGIFIAITVFMSGFYLALLVTPPRLPEHKGLLQYQKMEEKIKFLEDMSIKDKNLIALQEKNLQKYLDEIDELQIEVRELNQMLRQYSQRSVRPEPRTVAKVEPEKKEEPIEPQPEEHEPEDPYVADESVDENVYNDPSPYVNLRQAIQNGDIKALKKMIEQGYDVNTRSKHNSTPLHLAVYYDNKEAVDLLLKNGAGVANRNYAHMTPLHFAKSKDIVKLLIQGGADTNTQNSLKETPLYHSRDIELVKLYIEYGADVNLANHLGKTPIFNAKDPKIVQYLYDHGASINLEDSEGKTALDYAQMYGQAEKVKILESLGAVKGSNATSTSSIGIGVRLKTKDGYPTVVSASEGSPAFDAGLKAGDVILEISQDQSQNGRSIKTMGIRMNEVITHIKGSQGSTVFLKVKDKNGDIRDIPVRRALLKKSRIN